MFKICFFTSIGNDLSLFNYIKQNHNDFDIICNYYENNEDTYKYIQDNSKYATNEKLSKFQSLKILFDKFIKDQYDYIYVYDDDAIIKFGNLYSLIEYANNYNIDIISSAHDPNGKITYDVHKPQNKSIRLTNFIEMNFPVFSNYAIKKFMQVYDGVLCGWGIDYWYSQLSLRMAIIDKVIILNPKNSTKINNLMSTQDRYNQWIKCKNKYSLKQQIYPENLLCVE